MFMGFDQKASPAQQFIAIHVEASWVVGGDETGAKAFSRIVLFRN